MASIKDFLSLSTIHGLNYLIPMPHEVKKVSKIFINNTLTLFLHIL